MYYEGNPILKEKIIRTIKCLDQYYVRLTIIITERLQAFETLERDMHEMILPYCG